jgi:hypothetical protein
MTYYPNTIDLGGRYGRFRPTRSPLTNPNATWRTQPMTDTQAAKIVKELGRRVVDAAVRDELLAAVNSGQTRDGKPATKGSASDLIDWLMAKPYAPRNAAVASTSGRSTDQPVGEAGIYRFTDGSV